MSLPKSYPPQTIMSLPVHTAVWKCRAVGALATLVVSHVFVLGLYRPPVLAVEAKRIATPDDHFGAGLNRCVEVSATGGDGSARSCPAICARIIPTAGVDIAEAIKPSPNDHFTAGPDCGVGGSGGRIVVEASSCPRIRAGIVSAACSEDKCVVLTSPHD